MLEPLGFGGAGPERRRWIGGLLDAHPGQGREVCFIAAERKERVSALVPINVEAKEKKGKDELAIVHLDLLQQILFSMHQTITEALFSSTQDFQPLDLVR